LGLAAWLSSLPLAILALCIPGVVGCAAPVGKSLIASATGPEVRVQEFAKLACLKGVVKLSIPLAGAFIFKYFLGEMSFVPLFFISAALSFCCFLYSFTFPHICCSAIQSPKKSTFSILKSHVRTNFGPLLVFLTLITAYIVFVKYTPFVLFESLSDNPSIVNYFASLVGLAYTLNQLIVVRFADRVAQHIHLLFIALCSITISLCFLSTSPLWFLAFFGVLFCFSALNTCVEAKLSLQGVTGNQGTVQGILYSVENWGYIIAPMMGSFVASFSTVYPLYFVTVLVLFASIIFMLLQKRVQSECYTKTG
jgi:predicted MFS family arabinose efflux permease